MPSMTKEKSYPDLQAWLRRLVDERKSETRDSIAAAGGIHSSNVSHWLRSGGRPGVRVALRIAAHVGASGIDVLDWCGYKEEAEALRSELARHGAAPGQPHDCQKVLGLGDLPPLDDKHLDILATHNWLRRHRLDVQVSLVIRQFLLSIAVVVEEHDGGRLSGEIRKRFPAR